MSLLSRLARAVAGAAVNAIRPRGRGRGPTTTGRDDGPRGPVGGRPGVRVHEGPLPALRHEARADGRPDPGEVVWAWVPYEDDPSRGKDRPVLLLAEHEGGLLGLQLTSQDHDRDAEQEARWGRSWVDVGSGGWDARRRPSEARLDRVLWLAEDAIRREGAALDESRFAHVLVALREHRHGA
ncbi:type II toxin-antitoxin system PemK/MazF family toxin [Ruania suaedae]|uniref:type II toxin-antitoxin system PemK/MazF family toxin n=1 Tax=Ruania suaedae TaxID=2897774 RepID=UPI001E5C5769|nr:type II toxin-antitoxin system PemK/MazF family toxin [Ruania suaedae]UFU01756.1 type II toxin-antitoxin system PemK/MazF family toxin [Ruania suaedae]